MELCFKDIISNDEIILLSSFLHFTTSKKEKAINTSTMSIY